MSLQSLLAKATPAKIGTIKAASTHIVESTGNFEGLQNSIERWALSNERSPRQRLALACILDSLFLMHEDSPKNIRGNPSSWKTVLQHLAPTWCLLMEKKELTQLSKVFSYWSAFFDKDLLRQLTGPLHHALSSVSLAKSETRSSEGFGGRFFGLDSQPGESSLGFVEDPVKDDDLDEFGRRRRDPVDEEQAVCKLFLVGQCLMGSNCPLFHDRAKKQQIEALLHADCPASEPVKTAPMEDAPMEDNFESRDGLKSAKLFAAETPTGAELPALKQPEETAVAEVEAEGDSSHGDGEETVEEPPLPPPEVEQQSKEGDQDDKLTVSDEDNNLTVSDEEVDFEEDDDEEEEDDEPKQDNQEEQSVLDAIFGSANGGETNEVLSQIEFQLLHGDGNGTCLFMFVDLTVLAGEETSSQQDNAPAKKKKKRKKKKKKVAPPAVVKQSSQEGPQPQPAKGRRERSRSRSPPSGRVRELLRTEQSRPQQAPPPPQRQWPVFPPQVHSMVPRFPFPPQARQWPAGPPPMKGGRPGGMFRSPPRGMPHFPPPEDWRNRGSEPSDRFREPDRNRAMFDRQPKEADRLEEFHRREREEEARRRPADRFREPDRNRAMFDRQPKEVDRIEEFHRREREARDSSAKRSVVAADKDDDRRSNVREEREDWRERDSSARLAADKDDDRRSNVREEREERDSSPKRSVVVADRDDDRRSNAREERDDWRERVSSAKRSVVADKDDDRRSNAREERDDWRERDSSAKRSVVAEKDDDRRSNAREEREDWRERDSSPKRSVVVADKDDDRRSNVREERDDWRERVSSAKRSVVADKDDDRRSNAREERDDWRERVSSAKRSVVADKDDDRRSNVREERDDWRERDSSPKRRFDRDDDRRRQEREDWRDRDSSAKRSVDSNRWREERDDWIERDSRYRDDDEDRRYREPLPLPVRREIEELRRRPVFSSSRETGDLRARLSVRKADPPPPPAPRTATASVPRGGILASPAPPPPPPPKRRIVRIASSRQNIALESLDSRKKQKPNENDLRQLLLASRSAPIPVQRSVPIQRSVPVQRSVAVQRTAPLPVQSNVFNRLGGYYYEEEEAQPPPMKRLRMYSPAEDPQPEPFYEEYAPESYEYYEPATDEGYVIGVEDVPYEGEGEYGYEAPEEVYQYQEPQVHFQVTIPNEGRRRKRKR